jgi:uncharacterized protein YutE (UPF0331/DUF86 family)
MKAEIVAKLRELEKYARLLEKYKGHDVKDLESDLTLRGAVERYMQLSIEIVIEIGEMIIASEGFRKPETYREVIEILGEEGVLSKGFSKRFAPAAGFRNILVHRYGEIELQELYNHLQKDIRDFDEFARQVSVFLNKK